MNHPCKKDCPRRGERCFLSCPEWKQYEAERKERYRQRELELPATDYFFKSANKNIVAGANKETRGAKK